jgi:hypothetical protein
MRRWWKDLDQAEQRAWSGLHVVLDDLRGAPALHVAQRAGDIEVVARGHVVLHAEVERYMEGVRIERDFAATARLEHDFPFAHIRADDLRKAPERDDGAWWQYWCRWVAEQLSAENIGYTSDWAIQPARLPEYRQARPRGPVLLNLDRAFEDPAAVRKSWMLNGSNHLLTLRPRPEEHEGRIKHWRKQARAGHLPPIVAWWISALDCWLLIDGHRRLLATLLEGVPPTVIGVYSFIERNWPVYQPRLDALEREFAERTRAGAMTPVAIDSINRTLVETHRQDRYPVTRAWYRPGSETEARLEERREGHVSRRVGENG